MTDPRRVARISAAWRSRPKGNLFETSRYVRLTTIPSAEVSMADPGPDVPLRSIGIIDFDFELKLDRGVNTWGEPQIRRQVVCEGVVVEEAFFPDLGSSEPPTLS